MHQVKQEIHLEKAEVTIQVSSNLRLNEDLAFLYNDNDNKQRRKLCQIIKKTNSENNK
jgi:hypothetical protein